MKFVFIFLACFPLIIFGQHQTAYIDGNIPNPNFDPIKDSLLAKVSRGEIPSISVAVSKNGKVVWQQSFGWADKEKKIKATPFTPYALASISKSITATAIMILIQKGLVNLNNSIDTYLGNAKLRYFRHPPSPVTIKHILNMTAGIPHQWEYHYLDENATPLSFEKQLKRYGIVAFQPGEQFLYSNFSPAIAEQIIRHVTKKSLSAFLKEYLFTPLEMTNSYVNKSDKSGRNVAKGYDNSGQALAASEFYPKGGAGYYAAVSDLLKYGMFHLKDKPYGTNNILTNKNIDFLHTPVEYTQRNKFYAYGWGVLTLPNSNTTLLSNGAIDGAASSLLLLTDKEIAIACLTNATIGNDFTDQIAYAIANILEPGYKKDLENFLAANAPAFEAKPFRGFDTLSGTWEGSIISYKDSIPIQIKFDTNGRIYIRIHDGFETLLNNVTTNDGIIEWQCYGYLSLNEAGDLSQFLQLQLKPGKAEMYGCISAQSYKTKRPYFLIPAYLSLRKIKSP